MSQVINAKTTVGPNAIGYGNLFALDFDTATLSSNQTTGTVAAVQPLLFAVKVIGLSVMMTTVNGTAPVAVNLCAGVAAQGGLGPTDPLYITGYPPTAAQMMGNGNILWATDQQLNGSSAPVANTVYRIYPVADMWDAIWNPTLPMTLRVSAGAAAANGLLKAIAYCVPVDIYPNQPAESGNFAPSATVI